MAAGGEDDPKEPKMQDPVGNAANAGASGGSGSMAKKLQVSPEEMVVIKNQVAAATRAAAKQKLGAKAKTNLG